MELVRVEAPADPVITLEEARLHLRVEPVGSPPVHEEDELITAAISSSTQELDGVDGWLGRALVTQKWKLVLPGFPDGCGRYGLIRLPLTSAAPVTSPPTQLVDSITYVASDGTVTVLDAAAYRVLGEFDPNVVEPTFGTVWPSTRRQSDAVSITYTAGYGAAAAVPASIKSYMLVRIGQLYEHRELVLAGAAIAPVPYLRDSLEGYRQRVGWGR
jgi:uncharacterized phiE125 gp8 family phage protein